jgi:hypothetical protein
MKYYTGLSNTWHLMGKSPMFLYQQYKV